MCAPPQKSLVKGERFVRVEEKPERAFHMASGPGARTAPGAAPAEVTQRETSPQPHRHQTQALGTEHPPLTTTTTTTTTTTQHSQQRQALSTEDTPLTATTTHHNTTHHLKAKHHSITHTPPPTA